jgi:hypothetical protein
MNSETDSSESVTNPSARTVGTRLAELSVGLTVNQILVVVFDYILYPVAIAWLGLWYGGAIMAFVSLVTCIGMLRFYDWSGRDWLGIEAAKQIREYVGHSRWRRWLAWVLHQGDLVVCVVLSIKFDPFITTAYMRHGAFNGMSRRDWRIFWASWFIGNAYWTFVCFGGVKALRWAWNQIA